MSAVHICACQDWSNHLPNTSELCGAMHRLSSVVWHAKLRSVNDTLAVKQVSTCAGFSRTTGDEQRGVYRNQEQVFADVSGEGNPYYRRQYY